MENMKTSALDSFYVNDLRGELLKSIVELEKEFQAEKDIWKARCLDSFGGIFKTIQRKQDEGSAPKASFLVYTLLRTNLMQGKEEYAVFLYDDEWYLGNPVKVGEMDVSHVYRHRQKLHNRLKECVRKYMLNLTAIDVDTAAMSILNYYHQYVVGQLRYSIADVLGMDEFKRIKKAGSFEILSGEYNESCDLICKYTQEDEFAETLKDIRANKYSEYICRDMSDIILANMNLRYLDFSFSILNGATLNNADISGGRLAETKFRGADMKNTNFGNADIHGTDFSQGNLEGAVFDECMAFTGKDLLGVWENAGYTNAKFNGSILKGAGFRNALLLGADFRGADLENADFEGACVNGAIFNKKHLEHLNFSKTQLKSIKTE